jgi:hypothetical protein
MDTKENMSKTYTIGDVDHSTLLVGENNTLSVKVTSLANKSDIDAAAIQDALDTVVLEMRRTAKTAAQLDTIDEVIQAKEAIKNNDKRKAIEHMKNCGKWLVDVSKQVGAQVLVNFLTGS